MFINAKNSIIVVPAIILFAISYVADANVQNTVSATANSGGNMIEGNGTIKTGDATATVNAQNYVNGGEDAENKIEARAEVQGEGAQASVSVNGEEKSCTTEEGESCEVEIEKGSNGIEGEEGENNNKGRESSGNNGEGNIVQAVASAISNFTKSLTDKIISWLS